MMHDRHAITSVIARFPTQFGLRAFPGDRFRISRRSSFVDDSGHVKLYTQRLVNGEWLDFAKGTEAELRKQVVPLVESSR